MSAYPMMGLLDNCKILICVMSLNASCRAQLDTNFFSIDDFKLNDSTSRRTEKVFMPEIGLYPLCEMNKYYTKGRLVEENTSFGGRLNGMCKKYYLNGQLKEISNYVLGSLMGLYCDFHDNGRVKSIGEYVLNYDDGIVELIAPIIAVEQTGKSAGAVPTTSTIEYGQGKKNGKWLYFDRNGTKIKEEDWRDGKLIK